MKIIPIFDPEYELKKKEYTISYFVPDGGPTLIEFAKVDGFLHTWETSSVSIQVISQTEHRNPNDEIVKVKWYTMNILNKMLKSIKIEAEFLKPL